MQEDVRRAFCSLVHFKVHGENIIEIITPFYTVNKKAVSVFVTRQGPKLVATDGGWLTEADREYGTPISLESVTVETYRFIEMLGNSFGIKETKSEDGIPVHYYRTTVNTQEVPAMVYDLANFIAGAINALCYEGGKEVGTRMLFQRDAKDFIQERFGQAASFNTNPIPIKNIKFDAVVRRGEKLALIDYVTGATKSHFVGDVNTATVDFAIVKNYKLENFSFKRLILFNDKANGYKKDSVETYMEFLKKQTSVDPISWSRKEELIEVIESD